MPDEEFVGRFMPVMKELGSEVITSAGVLKVNHKYVCQRCGNKDQQQFYTNPYNHFEEDTYCLACFNLGKVSTRLQYGYLPERNQFQPIEPVLTWQGQLSEQQALASQDIIKSIDQKEVRLIWAVTGAGKTEMLFAGIAHALKQKLRVCLASPRVDVCLELFPRLQDAFQNTPMTLLYGDQEEAYRYCQLTVCTSHQLLRFRQAFDLLIVDEVDAFPFVGDTMLEAAVNGARKPEATLIYLSATPTYNMQKEVKTNQLQATILPARYHGHPLPVPCAKFIGDWSRISENTVFKRIFTICEKLIENGKRYLIFAPMIHWMHEFERGLKLKWPNKRILSVFASDPDRQSKVLQLRQEAIDILLTTTILERGVTFRDIQVIVIGADAQIFTSSALVQIAGRAGRHPDYFDGSVSFLHNGMTEAIQSAISQIKMMNRLARERGLIQ